MILSNYQHAQSGGRNRFSGRTLFYEPLEGLHFRKSTPTSTYCAGETSRGIRPHDTRELEGVFQIGALLLERLVVEVRNKEFGSSFIGKRKPGTASDRART